MLRLTQKSRLLYTRLLRNTTANSIHYSFSLRSRFGNLSLQRNGVRNWLRHLWQGKSLLLTEFLHWSRVTILGNVSYRLNHVHCTVPLLHAPTAYTGTSGIALTLIIRISLPWNWRLTPMAFTWRATNPISKYQSKGDRPHPSGPGS